jgi:osmotically-inducible protein OsmY
MSARTPIHATLLATAAAALMLTACGRNDDGRTAGQKLDSAIATADAKGEQAKQEMKQDAAQAKDAVRDAAADVKSSTAAAADKLADKVEDATITASVNAELAKDASLSALKINVDTVGGKVSLRGTAPDAQSRERATRLASNVKGVTGVDNQLEVRS